MLGAEVVDRTIQIHRTVQRRRLACQSSTPPNQCCNTRAKGGVQPFDVSSVNGTSALCSLQQGLHLVHGALDQTPLMGDNSFASILPDDLGHRDAIPRSQTRTPDLTRADGLSKDRVDGLGVRLAAIHAEQQRTTQGTSADFLHQRRDQACVATGAEHATQPKSGTNLQRDGHPHSVALNLHSNLVSLDLGKVFGFSLPLEGG